MIKKCSSCNNDVVNSVAICPFCKTAYESGALKRSPNEIVSGCIGIILLALLFYGIGSCSEGDEIEQSEKATEAAPNKSKAISKEEKAQNTRASMAVLFRDTFKKDLNDPASFELVNAKISDDIQTFCMIYRAKNGFGALIIKSITIVGNEILEDEKSMQKHCSNDNVYDVTDSIKNRY